MALVGKVLQIVSRAAPGAGVQGQPAPVSCSIHQCSGGWVSCADPLLQRGINRLWRDRPLELRPEERQRFSGITDMTLAILEEPVGDGVAGLKNVPKSATGHQSPSLFAHEQQCAPGVVVGVAGVQMLGDQVNLARRACGLIQAVNQRGRFQMQCASRS